MVQRPCIVCGVPTAGTRCPVHEAERTARVDARRGSSTARGYGYRWSLLRAEAIRRQPFCADCGATTDLTGDHRVWPARTLADVAVVCRGCNSARGAVRHRVVP